MSLRDWLVDFTRRYPFVAIFFIALVLRLAYLAEIMNTPIWEWHTLLTMDTDTFLKVAEQIRGGDLSVPAPYHPYRNHSWMQALGSEEQWERWLGAHSFVQAPGYYYFLAGMLSVFSGSLGMVRIFHLVLGAAHAAVLGAVGEKMLGRTGGIVVGLLAASYGPFIAVEAMVLRDGPALFFATGGFYLVLKALERERVASPGGSWAPWLLAGSVLGLAALMKETGLILLAGVVVWMLLMTFMGRDRLRLRAAVLLLAGAFAAFSPLVVRNLVVGAPPVALSSVFPVHFAIANAIDAPAGGMLFSIPQSVPAVMQRTEGRLLPTIRETLRPYEANPSRFLAHMSAKLSAMWSNVELPDNFSYEYFTRYSKLLSILPRFAVVWILALLGGCMLILSRLMQGSDTSPSPDGRSTGMSLVATVLVLQMVAQSFAIVMSRYRLVIVPMLMIPAGLAVATGLQWMLARRWRAVAAWSGGLALLCVMWWAWPAEARMLVGAVRPVDFAIGAESLAQHDNMAGAWAELEQGIRYSREHAALSPGEAGYAELLLRRDRLLMYVRRGRFAEVQEDWDVLRQTVGSDDPAIQEVLRFLEQGNTGTQ